MKFFPHPLVTCQVFDKNTNGDHRIGFSFEGNEISDTSISSCGRFEARPADYGLDDSHVEQLQRLNAVVDEAVEKALNVGAQLVQSHLGVEAGDVAAAHFDGVVHVRRQLWEAIADYAIAEVSATCHPASPDAGIVFVASSNRGGYFWTNRDPLRLGYIRVQSYETFCVPKDLESEGIQILVYPYNGMPPEATNFKGRQGMNDLYLRMVGYRPDDEEYEPDPGKLLALVVEMFYRHATGDDR